MSRQRSDDVIKEADLVTIGELVRLTAIRYSTIKFYSDIGVIPFEQDGGKATRYYRRVLVVDILSKIQDLRDKKMSVEEIKKELQQME